MRGKRFVLREDVELLQAPPEPPPSVAFLPPFDPLVWDRRLLGSLFGFDYVWELFLPPAKRRWGWYVLPILFRDRFVGRIEPRIDRADARVHVIDVWWEDGFAPRRAEGFVDAMRDALRAYLRFAGASRIEWAPHLGTEKRLFLTRPWRTLCLGLVHGASQIRTDDLLGAIQALSQLSYSPAAAYCSDASAGAEPSACSISLPSRIACAMSFDCSRYHVPSSNWTAG